MEGNNKPIVHLISKPNNMLKTIYTACRTCYSADSPINIYENAVDEEKMLKLIKRVVGSGHYSTIEHIQVSFAISNVSRACTHQLVRHRHMSFSQKSQRYVKEKGQFDYIIPPTIEKNPELKIEDLKDKSITEITNLKENKKEETTQTTTAITNPTVKTTKKTTVKTTVSIPSNPTDTSGVWCTYNKNKPAASKFDYPADIGLNKAREYALSAINSSSLGLKENTLSRVDDKRSSYCLSYKFMGYNDDNKYYVTIDSVTGSVIEKSVVLMDKPKITEEEAKTIGINRFGIDPNACDFVQAYLDMNNGKLRYTFAARCSGTQYDLEIDAITGAVSKERTWT